MINLRDASQLKQIFTEVEGTENRNRRYAAYKELDIYNQNQEKYIDKRIAGIYGKDAVNSIQTITSINLATRIVNAEASIYKKEPERTFEPANEKEKEHIDLLYKDMQANEKLKLTNKLFKLGSQCALMVLPDIAKKCLKARVLYKHQYDVIPLSTDPESAMAYIIPIEVPNDVVNKNTERTDVYNRGDNINQAIADRNDKDMSKYKYIVWSKDLMFYANGNGTILNPENLEPWLSYSDLDIANPINELPIIDVAAEKLFGFWVDHGSSLTDFTITFGCILSDMGEIVKLQGYSQPVISSIEEPKTISVGPHRVMWLKKDPNNEGDKDPKFEFATPSPDIDGSLNFIENVLRMFLTSRGTDSKLVTSKDTKDFSSGFERLLAMIDRSEATNEDKILFKRIEEMFFNLVRKWNNFLQENQQNNLRDDLKGVKIADNIKLNVKFAEPMQVQTQSEKEDSIIKRLDAGLMSKLMAIMELYGLDKDAAKEKLKDIDDEVLEEIKKRQDLVSNGESSDDEENSDDEDVDADDSETDDAEVDEDEGA